MEKYPLYVKEVSKAKHVILENYFKPWAIILGSVYDSLGYIDCFAGKGMMKDVNGQHLPGSPIVALQTAKKLNQNGASTSFHLWFVDENPDVISELQANLASENAIKGVVEYDIIHARAEDFAEQLISLVKKRGPGVRLIPTFVFIDPFGYPLSLPRMREMLSLGKTELLVTIMSYRINMDLSNPKAKRTLDGLFGHSEWQQQPFVKMSGKDRELAMIDYIARESGAKYGLPFRVPFSPEDNVPGAQKRTKYYLLHLSNHYKAALLMKNVMRKARAFVDSLEYNVSVGEAVGNKAEQLSLFDTLDEDVKEPVSLEDTVANELASQFAGQQKTFVQIQLETLQWPYINKEYRAGINKLISEKRATIQRNRLTKSGRLPSGVSDFDIITFA